MQIRSEKFLLWAILTCIALLFLIIAVFSEGTYDSGDGIQHYLFSRYSWKHPELFLHHWGKPFFILVSSPFTQFGLIGANIFNILCAVGSAFFCYKIAKKSEINFPLFVVPFLCLAPIYFAVIQSGLTEPFFGFVLIFSIYLFMEKKILAASILVSFLPFVRSEGNMILPLFFILLLYHKKFWVIPFLATGTIIYSIIGSFYYKDLLWVIHQNPYRGAADIYGHGTIYHFLIREEFIWGTPLFMIFAAGCLWVLFSIKKAYSGNYIKGRSGLFEEVVLIYGSFFVYFIAHTIFWWQGIFSSLGLIRVIAGVMPVSAIISLRGFNFILPFFKKNLKTEKVFFSFTFLVIIMVCVIHNRSIMKLNKEDVVIKKSTNWLKNSEYSNRFIFYLHPYISLALNLDRFDRTTNGEIWALMPEHPESGMPSNSILLWDAHFGPNEGGIKLDTLLNNNSFVLLNKFVPEKEFNVLGGNKFEVYIFERK